MTLQFVKGERDQIEEALRLVGQDDGAGASVGAADFAAASVVELAAVESTGVVEHMSRVADGGHNAARVEALDVCGAWWQDGDSMLLVIVVYPPTQMLLIRGRDSKERDKENACFSAVTALIATLRFLRYAAD